MTVRPLPRSLDPLPDESLPGFVLRLAHRLERTPARVAQLTGLTDPGQLKPNLGRRIYLDPATRDRFAAATRLHPDEVAALCVAGLADRYAPLNARFLGRTRQPESVATDPWVYGRAIRYCPACLAGDGSAIQIAHGGAWQRRWHLPVVFACTTHQQLLTEHCPTCRQPIQHDADQPVPAPTVPGLHPAQCRNRTADTKPGIIPTVCGHHLDRPPPVTASAAPQSALLQLQQRIHLLLDPAESGHTTSFGQPATAAEYFTDVRLLASLTTITWPTAAALLPDGELRAAADRHATTRHQTIVGMRANGKQPRSYAIYDQPPTDSLATAALLLLLDDLTTSTTAADTLTVLLRHDAAHLWTRHFFTAEPYCSAGLRAAIAAPVNPHRPKDRPPAAPRPPRAPRPPAPQQPRTRALHRSPAKPSRPPKPAPQPRHAPKPKPPRPPRAPRPPARKTSRVLPPLPRYRFGPEHVPAFLTDAWYTEHLQHLTGIDQRLLRRATASTLVSRAGKLSARKVALHLHMPPNAVISAVQTVKRWRAADAANARGHDAALAALTAHLETVDLINYQRRRHAMTTWTLSAERWQAITDQLRRTESCTQRAHSDYSDRKRITASALAWIDITHGEHRYAPQRHAPGAKAGTTQDPGLSIDRAWWRLRNGKPGQHYWDLRAALTPHVHELAVAIDSGSISAN